EPEQLLRDPAKRHTLRRDDRKPLSQIESSLTAEVRNRPYTGPVAVLGAILQDRSQEIVILFHDRTTSYMKHYRLCFLGFGNVGRALVRLFVSKAAELRDNYGIEWEITGVATRRMGWRASDEVIDVSQLLAGNDQTHTE